MLFRSPLKFSTLGLAVQSCCLCRPDRSLGPGKHTGGSLENLILETGCKKCFLIDLDRGLLQGKVWKRWCENCSWTGERCHLTVRAGLNSHCTTLTGFPCRLRLVGRGRQGGGGISAGVGILPLQPAARARDQFQCDELPIEVELHGKQTTLFQSELFVWSFCWKGKIFNMYMHASVMGTSEMADWFLGPRLQA